MLSIKNKLFESIGMISASITVSISMFSLIGTERYETPFDYRTQAAWGANLGNWLILEKWMDSTVFDRYAPEATDEWSFSEQASNPAEALKEHWESWITEQDFVLLAKMNANHVRIPIGYWAFIQPDKGEPYVYGDQKAQLERILGYCKAHHIYAILDLHGLPGSQNGNDHSGHKGPTGFFTIYNIRRGIKTVQAILDWINSLGSDLRNRIAAIEAANEPDPGNDQLYLLKYYYLKAFKLIRNLPFKVNMMFHDGFKGLETWKYFLPSKANAVIDLHPYYAFPPIKETKAIIDGIHRCKKPAEKFHLPVFYGEWSLASGVPSDTSWLKTMMDSQISVFKSTGAGGTFWTMKNNINSNVWSFEHLVREGVITPETFTHHSSAQC
ncbi:glycoside hydrolase superfamily [Blakeslea trispora]|nr:glycoside hydrolase superfamily [Blakeslea trispora]